MNHSSLSVLHIQTVWMLMAVAVRGVRVGWCWGGQDRTRAHDAPQLLPPPLLVVVGACQARALAKSRQVVLLAVVVMHRTPRCPLCHLPLLLHLTRHLRRWLLWLQQEEEEQQQKPHQPARQARLGCSTSSCSGGEYRAANSSSSSRQG